MLTALRDDPALRLLPPRDALPPDAARVLGGRGALRTWRVPHPCFGRDGNEQSFARWDEVGEGLRAGALGIEVRATMMWWYGSRSWKTRGRP